MADDEERRTWVKAWRAALQAQAKAGELMMKVDQNQLTDAEKAEFNALIGNLQAQFAAIGKVIQTVSGDDLYKQAIASSERLLERTEYAIGLLEKLIAKQS